MSRANVRLAFDRSLRRYDKEGRLHVAASPISKSNIRPYLGREIPFADVFGLEPDRVYAMFCPPDQLAKAAPSSNNIQLLDIHVGVSAREPHKGNVVGSTGTDAAFDGQFLRNSLVIWDVDAIRQIEDGSKRELSASYGYTPVMEPGTFLGERYDGLMYDIQFNHIATVTDGRAGADVLVSDAMPIGMKGDTDMTLREKLRAKMEASGASKALIEELDQMFDDEGADDDIDEMIPLKDQMEPRGEDRALAYDMATTDPWRKSRAYIQACAIVKPYVGEVVAASDAAGVFRQAIRKLGAGEVLSSAPPREALPALFKLVAARVRGGSPALAMDKAAKAAFDSRYPEVARLAGQSNLSGFGSPSRYDIYGKRLR